MEPLSMENLFQALRIPPPPQQPPPLSPPPPYKPPTVLHHDDAGKPHRYRIMKPIGKSGAAPSSSSSAAIPVYKAAYIAEHHEDYRTLHIQDVFVAVKYINPDTEPEAFNNLRARINRNAAIPDHRNIVGIGKVFSHQNYICVVFPFMELGSMKSIMATRFPGGLPEDCIAIILKEALTGLKVIHQNGLAHGDISSGRIFLNGKPEIKLGFSATAFDLNVDQELTASSSSSSSDSISNWAAAPEVYESENPVHTAKSDVWSIGITALDLAFGGLRPRVMSREALDGIVRKINKKKKLPKKHKLKDFEMVKAHKPARFVSSGCMANPFMKLKLEKKTKFSKSFQKMVVKCLAMEPGKRPGVDELLQDEIFSKLDKNVLYFYNFLRNM